MPDEPPSDPDETSLTPSRGASSRTAVQTLCREVGAQHPDGALRQIRTMKRLLRSHYRVKQRLEQYGVESLSDAVARIAELSRRVRRYREEERKRAQDRAELIDDLMGAIDTVRQRLSASSGLAPPSSAETISSPLDEMVDLVEALQQAIDEIRLELWLHWSHDETDSDTPIASTAAQLVDRLDNEVGAAQQQHEKLRAENERLAARNDTLEQRVRRQQERIEELEQQLEQERSPTDD